jgi:hypothetical protein
MPSIASMSALHMTHMPRLSAFKLAPTCAVHVAKRFTQSGREAKSLLTAVNHGSFREIADKSAAKTTDHQDRDCNR